MVVGTGSHRLRAHPGSIMRAAEAFASKRNVGSDLVAGPRSSMSTRYSAPAMSVRIRLTRVGGHKDPVWRIVAADQRSPRDGRIIENLGQYNAQTDPSTINVDEEKVRAWLDKGAQPTAQVRKLLRTQGIEA